MARLGDGIYQRGRTWWLDFTHEGKQHVVRLRKGINRTVAGEIAGVKRAGVLKGEAGIGGRIGGQPIGNINASSHHAAPYSGHAEPPERPQRHRAAGPGALPGAETAGL